jgi:predicted ATPase
MLLRTLGGLKLESATFTRPKPLLLLAYLALEGPKERRFLSELFWLGATDPLNRLSTALARLRKAAPGVIDANEARVWTEIKTDAQELLSAVEAGEDEKALGLYKGPFLEGVYLQDWGEELEEWVYGTREHLAERVRVILLKLAEKEASQARFDSAAKRAETAYKLTGASVPEPEELPRLYTLMLAGNSPFASELRQEAEGYGIAVISSPEEAKAQLIKVQEDAKAAASTNLPLPSTPFIGREGELSEVRRLLLDEPDCRLITLLGPGGIGKTRLALAAASGAVGAFTHGVFFVPLASLDSADQMVSAVAEAVNFQLIGSRGPKEQMLHYLREKEMLLILDNFEHLLAGVELVTQILETAPQVKLLVTSRERLNLSGETILMLGGMDYPEKSIADEVLDYDAVKLLLQRARLARADLDVQEADLAHVVRICQLVQGMPLALVLAASWLEMLSFQEIADEVAANLDFLESEAHDLPERQRSVRAAFEYSWRRLSAEEQRMFMRLSVFRGGFTRQAAQAIAGAGLSALRRLVGKSLISMRPEGRYGIHELLRQYDEEKLTASGEEQATREAHSSYYLHAISRREADLKSHKQLEALNDIEADLDNVRAAWAWAIKQGRTEAIQRSLESLYYFYWIRSRFQEGQEAFADAVRQVQVTSSQPVADELLSKLLIRQGAFQYTLGRNDEANQTIQAGLAIARRLDLRREIAFSLGLLGDVAKLEGEHEQAIEHYQESLTISREMGDHLGMAYALFGLGWVATDEQGDYLRASQYYRESLELYRASGNQAEIAFVLDKLGHTLWKAGAYTEAEPLLQESLAIFQMLGDRLGTATALGALGLVAWAIGGSRLEEGTRLIEESLAICQETGHQSELANRLLMMGIVYNSLSNYAKAEPYWLEALAISKKLHYKVGITLALNGLGELACALGDVKAARENLRQALRDAYSPRRFHTVLDVLVNWAALLVKESDVHSTITLPSEEMWAKFAKKIQAVNILTLATDHLATWQHVRDKAAKLLKRLEAELAGASEAEAYQSARARGEALKLEEVVQELLASSSV